MQVCAFSSTAQCVEFFANAQAVGAGRRDTLPDVFQRCLLFLSIHALPSFAVLACMPLIYRSMGQAPEVCLLV